MLRVLVLPAVRAEAASQHISAVRRGFEGAHAKMERAAAEAAALGSGLCEATAAAAATGSALRQLAQQAT